MQFETVPFLKLSPVRQEVRVAIDAVLNKGVFMNGDYVHKFKIDFSKYLQLNHIVPTANCTDALEIILRSLGIQETDEVITTSFSWFSDASVIQIVGASIVFCDIDITHFGLNISDFENRITSKTKAIILPHLFGMVHPDVQKIASICREKKIILIEDCAQAHGATLNGKLAGTFGDITAFSFYPTKNLAALGDAGAIATNNEFLATKCQLWANHGQVTRNEHLQLGRNSRMDELQAAVLTANLGFLDSDNEHRRELAKIYFDVLQDVECSLPLKIEGHVYHQFVLRTKRRDELQKFLIGRGIETDIHYPKALSDMKIFEKNEKFLSASLASDTILSLPIHPSHTKQEIDYVAQTIKRFFRG
ncbi:DegT/DnrJ/EryC1/StrS family aminotransferase [Marivirga sp.]|uniref:DegT/DnrJ/EryC1/StrS family aminotransferase n=1 Tax=Marivirga sp. TaxID=2018662 RepID=UPI002D7E2663|nr:DegT/DnrJ/EryC1/StrS family aminotransferase [Marivirga sp.]HET8858669.1 DegT/DnrJ/EryC1/StrS family aminotransferase [Marivirga sp.]